MPTTRCLRSLLGFSVFCLLSGCATMRGQVYERNWDKYLPQQWTNQFIAYHAKYNTKAKVVRDGESFDVDFANTSDIEKIQSGDRIYLEAGRYTSIPNSAANLTFIGVPKKTIITPLDETLKLQDGYLVLGLNGTRFYDIGFHRVRFIPSATPFFVGVDFMDVDFVKDFVGLEGIVIFSDWGKRKGQFDVPYQPIGIDNVGSRATCYVLEHQYKSKYYQPQRKTTNEGDLKYYPGIGPLFVEMGTSIADALEKNSALFSTEAGVQMYLQRVQAIRQALPAATAQPGGRFDPRMLSTLLDITGDYVAHRAGDKLKLDTAQAAPYVAKARTEVEKKNYLTAMLLAAEAKDKQLGFEVGEVAEVSRAARKGMAQTYGCRIVASNTPDAIGPGTQDQNYYDPHIKNAGELYRLDMLASVSDRLRGLVGGAFPLFLYATESSTCVIDATVTVDKWSYKETDKSTTTETTIQETSDSKTRRGALQAAAERAAERAASKARAARWEAATEAMKDTASKMYEGRVRTEQRADGQYLVYGQGNFAGQASASTVADYEKNKAAAEAARMQAAQAAGAPGAKYEEVKTSTSTYNLQYRYEMGIKVTIHGGGTKPNAFYDAGSAVTYWGAGPCTRQERRGAIGGGVSGPQCILNFSGNGRDKRAYYLENTAVKFIEQYVVENIMPSAFQRIAAASKPEATDSEKLEATLLSKALEIKFNVDAVPDLTEKVVGHKLTLQEAQSRLY